MREDDLPGQIGKAALYGKIASVDLPQGKVTVAIGEIETQPIRWFTGGAGGTKVWTRPKVGEQVLVLSPDGDIAGAIAMRGITSDAFPPIADPDREIVRFEDGAVVAYDPAAHAMEIALPGGATVKIVAPGGVRIAADVEISGNLKVTGNVEADGDVKAGDISLRNHVHDKVQAGGAISGKAKSL